jgi:hypothetical protein
MVPANLRRPVLAALTARRVRYGVQTRPYLPAQPFRTLSPAAFPTALSLSFVPFPSLTFLYRPLVLQATPSSTYSLRVPYSTQNRYDEANGKMSQRNR